MKNVDGIVTDIVTAHKPFDTIIATFSFKLRNSGINLAEYHVKDLHTKGLTLVNFRGDEVIFDINITVKEIRKNGRQQ